MENLGGGLPQNWVFKPQEANVDHSIDHLEEADPNALLQGYVQRQYIITSPNGEQIIHTVNVNPQDLIERNLTAQAFDGQVKEHLAHLVLGAAHASQPQTAHYVWDAEHDVQPQNNDQPLPFAEKASNVAKQQFTIQTVVNPNAPEIGVQEQQVQEEEVQEQQPAEADHGEPAEVEHKEHAEVDQGAPSPVSRQSSSESESVEEHAPPEAEPHPQSAAPEPERLTREQIRELRVRRYSPTPAQRESEVKAESAQQTGAPPQPEPARHEAEHEAEQAPSPEPPLIRDQRYDTFESTISEEQVEAEQGLPLQSRESTPYGVEIEVKTSAEHAPKMEQEKKAEAELQDKIEGHKLEVGKQWFRGGLKLQNLDIYTYKMGVHDKQFQEAFKAFWERSDVREHIKNGDAAMFENFNTIPSPEQMQKEAMRLREQRAQVLAQVGIDGPLNVPPEVQSAIDHFIKAIMNNINRDDDGTQRQMTEELEHLLDAALQADLAASGSTYMDDMGQIASALRQYGRISLLKKLEKRPDEAETKERSLSDDQQERLAEIMDHEINNSAVVVLRDSLAELQEEFEGQIELINQIKQYYQDAVSAGALSKEQAAEKIQEELELRELDKIPDKIEKIQKELQIRETKLRMREFATFKKRVEADAHHKRITREKADQLINAKATKLKIDPSSGQPIEKPQAEPEEQAP